MKTRKVGKTKKAVEFRIGQNTDVWLDPKYASKWSMMLGIFKSHWLIDEPITLIGGKVSYFQIDERKGY